MIYDLRYAIYAFHDFGSATEIESFAYIVNPKS